MTGKGHFLVTHGFLVEERKKQSHKDFPKLREREREVDWALLV